MKLTMPEEVDKWIGDNIILLTITGSHAYGTNVETSDKDYRGITIPPEEYFLGLKHYNEYNTTGGKNFKNTKDDIDISIVHINKFVQEAISGVPNNIEILFVKDEFILKMNEFGKELLSHKHDFISKAIKHKFSGYAFNQMQKLKAKNSNGTGRQDLIEKFGFDTKFGSHSIRLLTSAIEILQTGTFSTFRPNRNELLAVRNGKYTLDQLLAIIEDLDKELNELYVTSKIPHTPDFNKINKWLIQLNKRALGYD